MPYTVAMQGFLEGPHISSGFAERPVRPLRAEVVPLTEYVKPAVHPPAQPVGLGVPEVTDLIKRRNVTDLPSGFLHMLVNYGSAEFLPNPDDPVFNIFQHFFILLVCSP